ncbi:MAG: DEAD/DEAH box helicase [Planctomycetes bacterium]|nr:DEAD/DEAH box helicase [Planctomycetota bacterium]
MTLEEWQVALRREFGRGARFRWKNVGDHRIFSEYAVTNPETERTYRVVIRGEGPGLNYCSCPDFAVNTLGTCKHIEFLLGKLGKTARQRVLLRKGHAPSFSEVLLRYGAERQVVFSPGTEAPRGLRRLAAQFFDERGVLHAKGLAGFDAFVKRARRFDHEVRIYEDALRLIAEKRDAERRAEDIGAHFGNGKGRWEHLVKARLYPYQREGALFAARAGRALIADDMGLGKTIQAIAATEILARECGVERALVVCPTSLKHQWMQEIQRFSGRPATVIEGLSHARRRLYGADDFYKIANYDVLHRDLDAIQAWRPDLVILDEAQRIKNWRTRAARSVKRIDSPYALVLTGTPLENRLEELHSIVEFIDRHRLGPLFRFLDAHQKADPETGRVVGYTRLKAIGETLKPILIRRTKAEVLKQLPERMDKTFFVPMTEEQRRVHEENREIVARIVAKWKKYHHLSEADQKRLTVALQRMRMCCDNTYLVDLATCSGPKLEELLTLLDEIFERREEKVVVFSQWQRMQVLISRRLREKGHGFVFLHGGVPGRKRKDLVKAFRDDDRVRVFLSTDAGGTGLNLQRASTVINMDLPWNPAVLEQRIGRVHRIGQERPVRVVNFVSVQTIEEGMLRVLAFKKAVFAGVLDGGEDEVYMGGSRLQKFMKEIETVAGAVPKPTQEAPPAPEELELEEAAEAREEVEEREERPVRSPEAVPVDALQSLFEAGASFLRGVTAAASSGKEHEPAASPLAALTETDKKTGASFLKIPLPDPEGFRRAAAALAPLIEILGRAFGK